MHKSYLSFIGSLTVALGFLLGPIAAAHASSFDQVQRVNSLSLQNTTDTFAPHNALGTAIVGNTARSQLASSIASGLSDGSISWLLDFSQLTDLSGTSNPSFNVGVLNGAPQEPAGNPTMYKGMSDLDWWYTANPADVDSNGVAKAHLPAAFSGGTFTAGPGNVSLNINFAGSALTLVLSDLRVQATSGATSAPTESSNGFPPGHLAGEHVSPTLTTFGSMASGELAGNISAQSLASVQIPTGLTGSSCGNLYTTSNTWLDVLVSGCTFATVVPEIAATQPDQVSAVGSGTYGFTVDSNHHVNACTHNGVADTLADCFAGAAYSGYFHFTTDRVILRRPCTAGSYSSDGYGPCTPAAPGYYVPGPGATAQTPCPTGKTSTSAGATSCGFFVTTTAARCAGISAVIGVATTCMATVADRINGPLPTGSVRWTRPRGGGTLSAGSCVLAASRGQATCSVRYTPAPGRAGSQQLAAAYPGDSGHASSGHQFKLKVVRRSSSIAVSCRPTTIVHGKSTTCTATVADASRGIAVAPKGSVKWSAPSRAGGFASTRCALASHNRAGRCTVTFRTKGTFRGQFSFTAAYVGDASHTGRTGGTRAAVT